MWLQFAKKSAVTVSNKPKKMETPKPQPSPKPVAISSHIMVTGNSFWGRYTNDHALKSSNPHAWPFARLKEFNREKYDAWITGTECPITKKGTKMTSAQMEATLTFNCDPQYLPEFAKWFDIVTLANNHTDNMGEDGFAETQKHLSENNIQYIGHYDPYRTEDICEVVSLPVQVKKTDGNTAKAKLPVALCGYHYVFKIPHQDAVDKIKEYAKYMPVIALPHGGPEYKPAPDQIKTTLYRSLIDAGADMVLGDHPHWVQTTEAYKGKLIVYSMGNFMFDQQRELEVIRSAAIDINMKSDSSSEITADTLEKWLQLGEKCTSYKDSCLTEAKNEKLPRIPFKFNYDFIATNDKGYQTFPDPSLRAGIEQRLNWNKTMKQLGQ